MEATRDRGRDQGRAGGARAAFLLALSLAVLSVVLFAATIVLVLLARSANVPAEWDVNLSIVFQLVGGLFLVFSLIGALITVRHPRNPIGWIFLTEGLLWSLTGFMDYYAVYGVASPGSVPFPVAVAGITNGLWVPSVGLLGTYVFLLFPDGRLPSGRWRPLAWLSGAVIVLFSVGVWLSPGRLQNTEVRNPFALEGYAWLFNALWVVLPLLPLCMLLSAASLVLRFRRSGGEQRQQIKWIAFAASLIGTLYLIAMAAALVFPQWGWFQPGSPLWIDILGYAALLGFTLVPIAVGIAILRYRLYDIDVIINRALVYGSLTASLVAVYFGGVTAAQLLFRTLTGQEEQPQLAVVVSTLAIAALFNPLRRRIQNFIDRRFYRRKYDARKTLEAFSARLREETNLDGLNSELLTVVSETVRPTHAFLWLRPSDSTRTRKDPHQ